MGYNRCKGVTRGFLMSAVHLPAPRESRTHDDVIITHKVMTKKRSNSLFLMSHILVNNH